MSFLKKYFFNILLLITYLLEGISKYYYYIDKVQIRTPRYVKLLILVTVIIYLVYKKKFRVFLIPVFLFLFFILGHYLMDFQFLSQELFVVFSKYIFPIFILEATYLYFKERSNTTIFKTFEIIIIINSICILFGVLFNLDLFNTYRGVRFGFNGLLVTSATGTYFYIIALFYVYLNLIKDFTKKNIFFFIIVFISSLLVGTKAIFLFLFCLTIYHIYFVYKKTNFTKKILISVGVMIPVLGVFSISVPTFFNIIKTHNLLSAIVSYRDILFYERTLPFIQEHWSILNYLVGGQGRPQIRTQLGFIDLMFFLGFIGSVVYLYAFYKSFVKIKLNASTLFLLISTSLIIFLAGNFFYSATITIYLLIIQQKLISNSL